MGLNPVYLLKSFLLYLGKMKSRQIQDKAHVVTLKKHYFGKSQKLLFKVQKNMFPLIQYVILNVYFEKIVIRDCFGHPSNNHHTYHESVSKQLTKDTTWTVKDLIIMLL